MQSGYGGIIRDLHPTQVNISGGFTFERVSGIAWMVFATLRSFISRRFSIGNLLSGHGFDAG